MDTGSEVTLIPRNFWEVIPIIVTTCKKNHGLLGNDVLNINSTKLVNEIKSEKTGKLKNYKASLRLKENVTSSYYETQKLTVHLLPLVVVKLGKLIEQDLLEYVPLGVSKCSFKKVRWRHTYMWRW